MSRFRFTIRRMMVAVAVVAAILAVATALNRREPMPRDAGEAAAYVRRTLPGLFQGDYDLEVRRLRPGEDLDGQGGAAFQVTFIRRDGAGAEMRREVVLVMEDGYCMLVSPLPRPKVLK